MSKKAFAVVTLTFEMPLSQPWDETATVQQIDSRARAEALEKARAILGGKASLLKVSRVDTHIVDESNGRNED
jgi:hypothetical protein